MRRGTQRKLGKPQIEYLRQHRWVIYLKLMFLAVSKSKIFSVRQDIVIVDKEPMFNLILGIDKVARFGTILDFEDKTIYIDHATISTRPLSNFGLKSNMCIEAFKTDKMYVPSGTNIGTTSFTRDHLKPINTREATTRTVEILYADSTKANLPEIVEETCEHLFSVDQRKLLQILTRYEELFDGTLGYFQTDPVKFDL
jgi:hypothetical protein